MAKISTQHRLDRRRAGVLLHPTSLPGAPLNGDLGANAYWFVDFLVKSGFTIWQTLPLVPPQAGLSPYQSESSHAGNIRLISLQLLEQQGWLTAVKAPESEAEWPAFHAARLRDSFQLFKQRAGNPEWQEAERFYAENDYWLDDYALFMALKIRHRGASWWEWEAPLRDRNHDALEKMRHRLAAEIDQHKFQQFLFFRQWLALRKYANDRQVLLFGDLPIFVAADSVDAWSGRENFQLSPAGKPLVVAGVPPDYFSATGQLWGNPHYDWARMEADGFQWWIQRLQTQRVMFDVVRIDHFRGFEAYWEIPANAPNAIHGRWVKAPGDALFKALQRLETIPLVAEDLGIITPEVTALRKQFEIPGMKILQFAFDGGPANPYLPHNYRRNSVVYTGTHDNNTTLGWFQELSKGAQEYVCEYLDADPADMPWPMIKTAMASVSHLAIIPMQDILGLDSQHRMNTPGVAGGKNWQWRFEWADVPHEIDRRLRRLVEMYGRL